MRGETATFAAVGDYGDGSARSHAVAQMVRGWNPDFVITLGDNNYESGSAETIDENIGRLYGDFIRPRAGRTRFFPALGNHDWYTPGARPYLDYFSLPGNERYYEFVWGPLHLFALDSDPREPDGITADSAQATWLRQRLAASTSCWRVVYMHHPPYSSGLVGPIPALRWPYRAWGADLVLAGHEHLYERLQVDGLTYVTNGLGGAQATAFQPTPLPQSQVRYNHGYGATRATATRSQLAVEFVTTTGQTADSFGLTGGCDRQRG